MCLYSLERLGEREEKSNNKKQETFPRNFDHFFPPFKNPFYPPPFPAYPKQISRAQRIHWIPSVLWQLHGFSNGKRRPITSSAKVACMHARAFLSLYYKSVYPRVPSILECMHAGMAHTQTDSLFVRPPSSSSSSSSKVHLRACVFIAFSPSIHPFAIAILPIVVVVFKISI